jgi:hypothetical protein
VGKDLLTAAKYQAAMNLRGEGDGLTPLRMWWTKKYQKSPRSPEYLSYTIFDLVVEFFEDYYDQNRGEMHNLDLPFAGTGDDMIDKWEREIRAGIVPDLMEDLPSEEAEKVINWSKKAYKNKVNKGMIPPADDGNIGDRIKELDDLLGSEGHFEEEY